MILSAVLRCMAADLHSVLPGLLRTYLAQTSACAEGCAVQAFTLTLAICLSIGQDDPGAVFSVRPRLPP